MVSAWGNSWGNSWGISWGYSASGSGALTSGLGHFFICDVGRMIVR